MNQLIKSLKKIVKFFESNHISYMLIGGIANSIYGNSRQTFDIDIKISLVEELEIDNFLKNILSYSTILVENPKEFLKQTHVLPIKLEDTRIDIILATLLYEKEAIKRCVTHDIFGIQTKVTTAEDLIIQKAISPRDKDWIDIEGIINCHRDDLDWPYILKHTREISEFIDDSMIIRKILALKN